MDEGKVVTILGQSIKLASQPSELSGLTQKFSGLILKLSQENSKFVGLTSGKHNVRDDHMSRNDSRVALTVLFDKRSQRSVRVNQAF